MSASVARDGAVAALDLREEWADLLRRRPALAGTLSVYGEIVQAWARSPACVVPLGWTAAACRERWERGTPLLAEAPRWTDAEAMEAFIGPALDILASLRPDLAPALQRFAEAWDRGELGPPAVLPRAGRVGDFGGLEPVSEVLRFLPYACVRPLLDALFADCRPHLAEGDWDLALCPFCGGPAGFADVIEDGRRRLACHLCGGAWMFSRLRCPACGNEATSDLVRLAPEAEDEGYAISACLRCSTHMKELDRRVRWNAGSPLVEDWGSPHLDLVARRAGYRRALPSLIELAGSA